VAITVEYTMIQFPYLALDPGSNITIHGAIEPDKTEI
jgi:hypothetical protein